MIFWAVTLSSLFVSLKSARWTGVGVIIGTAVPTAAIIGLGLWWTGSGRHSQIPFHASAILPAWNGLVYAAGIVVTGGHHQGGCMNWISFTSSFGADTMAVYKRAAAGDTPDVVPSARSSSR